MANFGRNKAVDPSGIPNAIVGAARVINVDRRDEVSYLRERHHDQRQQVAWRCFDEITEVKTAYNYYASVASRVTLHVGYQDSTAEVPAPIGTVGNIPRSLVTAARSELAKLGFGRGGQPNLIRALVLNLLVAGEAYLVGANGTYTVRSTSELRFDGEGRVRLITSKFGGKAGQHLPENAFIARIWRTHPQFSDDADTPMFGLLGECSDLMLISRLIRASVRSKLPAGILYVADELRFQRSSDPAGDTVDPDTDPFEEELTLALTDPIGDSDSPSEIMPLIIRGPAEFAKDGIVPIELGRTFDPQLLERYKQTMERILIGLEIPKDLVTSMSGVRYTNVQTLMEDFLKAHIEPMMVLVCEALTTVYLRPKLRARGYDEDYVQNVSVWYDPSEIVTRPDRSTYADSGYEKILLSGRTWRAAHGFTEADAPSNTEIIERVGLTGQIAPENMVQLMRAMDPDFVDRIERLSGQKFDDPAAMAKPAGPEPRPDVVNPGSPPGPAPTQPGAPTAPHPIVASRPETNPAPPPEGGLPPRNGTLEVASERVDQEKFWQLLQSLAANQQAVPSDTVRERERRLRHALEAERRLRDTLSAHLEDVVQRALERAGARTVAKVKKDSEFGELALTTSLDEVFSLIPADRRAEFGLDPHKLMGDVISGAKKQFLSLVSRAQKQGWRALGPDVFEANQEKQQSYLDRAWEWLSHQLSNVVLDLLHKPDKTGAFVPMEIIRKAQAIAGGGNPDEPRDSGRAVLSAEALHSTGWEFGSGHRWVYGMGIREPFEAHYRLDDVVFNDWQDSSLAANNPEQWPFVSHYHPGDHNGCQCDWLPELAEPAPSGGGM